MVLGSRRLLGLLLLTGVLSGCEFLSDSSSGADAGMPMPVPDCDGDGNPDDPLYATIGSNEYDCQVIKSANDFQEPDPMIFKAQISLESSFVLLAVSPDSPCGTNTAQGWTDAESKSFGLMQLTPACGWLKDALLPDGHPNLEKDQAAAGWTTSVFNPALNLAEGVRAISVNRAKVREIPGCTDDEYTMMALGAFNQGDNAVTGCGLAGMTMNARTYTNTVLGRYRDLAIRAHWPVRY